MWQFSILYDLFFSFCLWSAFVYVFVSLCCLHLSNFGPLTQWIPLLTLLTKIFLNFTLFYFFFLSLVRCPTPLVPIMPNYQSTKKKLSLQTLLSLSIFYLYNERERVTNTEWQSQSQKAQKKNTNSQIISVVSQILKNTNSQ